MSEEYLSARRLNNGTLESEDADVGDETEHCVFND
jgi:hypothetical protein